MSYLSKIRFRRTPQSLPLAGQVPNSAGGHAWAVDDWARLRRFLVLGTEGGSFYASEATLTRENAAAVERCLEPRRPAHGRGDRRGQPRRPRAEERPGHLRARDGGRLGDERDPPGRARRAARRLPHRHAPVPVRDASSRSSAAGAARCAARSARGTRSARRTSSPTRRSSTASATACRTATCSASPTRARRSSAGNPTLEVTREHARAVRVDRPRRRHRRPPARWSTGFARAQAADDAGGGGRARPRVRPAARGGPRASTSPPRRCGRRCSRTCR